MGAASWSHACGSCRPPDAPKDALGRGSPRGTVLGFLAAAQKGNLETASQYLNTPLKGAALQQLAQQLFSVLDRRLPPRLLELSDSPEGSLSTLKPNQDLIATISTAEGGVDIIVERVARSKSGSLWLFSRDTLHLIPELFDELDETQPEAVIPAFRLNTRVAGIALFNWIGLFVGLPAAYCLTGLLNRLLGLLVAPSFQTMLYETPMERMSLPIRVVAP